MARELEIVVTASTQQAVDALNQTERALGDVGDAAKKAGDKTDTFGETNAKVSKKTSAANEAVDLMSKSLMQYASYAAIGAAIDKSIDFGDAVVELSQKTGLSTEAVQRFGFVADSSGSSMDALANAVVFLNRNIEQNSSKTRDALEKLGLTTEQLMRLPIDARFEAVAKAIGQIEDPGQQAEAAMTLLNRSGKDLIPTLQAIADGAAETVPIIDEQYVQALANLRDEMDLVTRAGVVFLGTVVGGIRNAMTKDAMVFDEWAKSFQGMSEEMIQFEFMMKTMQGDKPNLSGMLPAGLPSVAVNDFEEASKRLDRLRASAERADRDTRRLAEAMQKADEASRVWGMGIEYAESWVQRLDAEILKLNASGGKKITDIFEFDSQPVDSATAALLKFEGSISYFSKEGSKAWSTFAQTVQRDTERFKPSFAGLATAFQNLGPAIVGAVQGGGSVSKTIGSMLGQGLGADLGAQLGGVIGKSLGPTLGKALGSLGGPLGAIAGQLGGELAGKLFGKFFGPSQQKLASDMRDKFFAAGGGIDAVRDRANAAGMSVDKLFNVTNVKDMEEAIKAFNQQLKVAEEAAAKAKEELAKMNTEMGTLLKEADTLGLVLPESLQLSIDKLIESGQLTEENKKLLEGLGRGSQSEFKAMEEAAKKYGVELTALGPAFNQNKVNETAADIIGSFDTMIKGGADLKGVIAGMSDEINKFVENAIKTGSTVPENMRPILDAMLKQGKLTDENGKKLTDLGGIKFGAPVETAIDKLISKIQELVDKMTEGLTNSFKTAEQRADSFSKKAADAINSVPREIDVRFREYAPETVGFDRGGVVGRDYRPPSSRDIIPALLRPGEVVLTPEQARMGGARGPAVNVVINVAGYLDSPTARTGLADIVRDELSKNLRRVGRAA
jgi:polyhydroxyalkanoate synthesis regulator phasin